MSSVTGIAVEGKCTGEERGDISFHAIDLSTGEVIFERGPIESGTKDIAEFLGIVLALAHLRKKKDYRTPVYSASEAAIGWARVGQVMDWWDFDPFSEGADMVRKAEKWLQVNSVQNKVIKWNSQTKGTEV